MKSILYVSNIEVPYRTQFFNLLARYCNLTVLYERRKSNNRDESWSNDQKGSFTKIFLDGKDIGNESSFSFSILKYVFGKYDYVIFGCFNSPVEVFAYQMMKIFHKPYFLNFDGESFFETNTIKGKLKCALARGAQGNFIAGVKSGQSLKRIVDVKNIYPYYFSSLTEKQIQDNSEWNEKRNGKILVVGQYYTYKGLDIAVKAARQNPDLQYTFIGMGKRTQLFIKELHVDELKNVEVIPFLEAEELAEYYKTYSLLVLPSRQECWGLVINEAASYGMPIVSTWGSGAAVEFLADQYPQFLAEPGNAIDLYHRIKLGLKSDNNEYSQYLIEKTKNYSIEKMVKAHCEALDL
jgi:glycosyltransferase involved in cell wall biosynthesis